MAHQPSKNVKPPPTLSQLQTTLTSLTTASSILQGFAHRNKNQHRGARWWGPFSMLSRSIRKLLPDLEGAVQRAEVLSTSSSSLLSSTTKRRKTDKDGQSVTVRQPELDKFVERAQWVHVVIGAQAYDAFTQLAADKQFAQLGLVLIGVLAQVDAAIAPFVVQDATETSDAAMTNSAEGTKTKPEIAPSAGKLATDDYDLGVAVPRNELDDDEDPQSPAEQSISQLEKKSKKSKKTPLLEGSDRARKMSEDGNRKRVKVRADLSNPGKDKNTDPMKANRVAKIEKKKKKKEGGDEFDDLFSSLL